jgi:hypothetical protein
VRTQDGQFSSNIAATTAAFTLQGGLYAAAVVATFGGGSVKLQVLGPDGSTYLSVSSGTDFTAAGYATVNLPFGTYRWTIATASAVYAEVNRIPGE